MHAGLVSSWNATVQRTGFQEHAVRPGDVAVGLNDRPFDEQGLEHIWKGKTNLAAIYYSWTPPNNAQGICEDDDKS